MAPPLRAPKGGETGAGAGCSNQMPAASTSIQYHLVAAGSSKLSLPNTTIASVLSTALFFYRFNHINSHSICPTLLNSSRPLAPYVLSPSLYPAKIKPQYLPLQTRGEAAVASFGARLGCCSQSCRQAMLLRPRLGELKQLALILLGNCTEHVLTIDSLATNRLSFLTLVIIPASSAQPRSVPA